MPKPSRPIPALNGSAILAELLPRIVTVPRPVVLVDGRSGAGKSTFAGQLARALGAQLVRLDDIYPGWGGLEAGSRRVSETILAEHNPGWQRWDWVRDRPAEWYGIDPNSPLVVEGCGALSAANRAHATWGIWIDLDDDTRLHRTVLRDGLAFEQYRKSWADQETVFAERENPRQRADTIIDGHQLTADVP